jgi:hypothetical protein
LKSGISRLARLGAVEEALSLILIAHQRHRLRPNLSTYHSLLKVFS